MSGNHGISRRAFVGGSAAAAGYVLAGPRVAAAIFALPKQALDTLPNGFVSGLEQNKAGFVAVGRTPDGTATVWQYSSGPGWETRSFGTDGVEFADLAVLANGSFVVAGSQRTTEQVGTAFVPVDDDDAFDPATVEDPDVPEVEVPIFEDRYEPAVWFADHKGGELQRESIEGAPLSGFLHAVAAIGNRVIAVGATTDGESQEGTRPLVLRRERSAWQARQATGLPGEYAEGSITALSATRGQWLLASSDIEGTTVYASRDEGHTWTSTSMALPSAALVTALAEDDEAFVGVESIIGGQAAVLGARGVDTFEGWPGLQEIVLTDSGPAAVVASADRESQLLTRTEA